MGDIVIDVPARKVTIGGAARISPASSSTSWSRSSGAPGASFARDALLSEAGRGDVAVGERTVDVHISHLRQKLGDDPRSPRLIKTVRGVGYVLVKDGPGSRPVRPFGPLPP